jgi:hypothetical protein
MTTSYSSGVFSHSQSYPLHTQFGSISPVSSYDGSADPGNTPYASNRGIASAFTGVSQQPVYNITNVYNSPMPQQQQQHDTSTMKKYNGAFTLVGGVLKLAGAVLSAHTGGAIGL